MNCILWMFWHVNGSLATKVYRKLTSTGQDLNNFNSKPAGSVKLALSLGLFNRALKYTIREADQQAEGKEVYELLRNNGYPERIRNKA